MRKKKARIYRIELPSENAAPLAVLPRDFLSFTLDTSFLLGGNWWGSSKGLINGVSVDKAQPLDLANPALLQYTKALSPAMIRIGGTEADHVHYKSGTRAALERGLLQAETETGNEDRALTLGKGKWKHIHRFIRESGLTLLFTVAAGPASRNREGAWLEANLSRLAAYSAKKGLPVAAWELGNEVNAFTFVYGRKNGVRAAQYGKDFTRFGNLLREIDPRALLVGPASAVWPKIGEPNSMALKIASGPAAGFLDAISWHYYPQQSSRGRVAVRRAGPKTMLNPKKLDEIRRYCKKMNRAVQRVNRCKPAHHRAENWLTETAHALYGGEPGVSDTFASTLWWLDELGLTAQEGISRVFRQSLVGSDYGLLREGTFEPTPDYFASVLWKRFMGPNVYPSRVFPPPDSRIRVYSHGGEGGPSLLAINLSDKQSVTASLSWVPRRLALLTGTAGLLSKTLSVNGIAADADLALGFTKEPTREIEEKYRLTRLDERGQAGLFDIPPLGALILSGARKNPVQMPD